MIHYSWAYSLNPEGIMLIIRRQKLSSRWSYRDWILQRLQTYMSYVNSAACAQGLHEPLHQNSQFRPHQTRCLPQVRQKFFPRDNIKVSIDEMQRKGTLHIGRIGKQLSQHWTFRAFSTFLCVLWDFTSSHMTIAVKCAKVQRQHLQEHSCRCTSDTTSKVLAMLWAHWHPHGVLFCQPLALHTWG